MKIGVLKILFQVKLKRRFAFKNENLNSNKILKSSIPQNLGQCTKKKNISKHVVTIRFFLKLTLYIYPPFARCFRMKDIDSLHRS